ITLLIITSSSPGYCLRVPLGASVRAQKTIEHIVHPDAIPWSDVNAFVNAIDLWLDKKGIGILDAFVFGSRANGREKKASDIDIGIFVDKHITPEDYIKLKSLWKGKLKTDLLVYSYDDLKETIRQIHPETPLDDGLLEEMKRAVGSMASDAVRIQVRRSAKEALLQEVMRRTSAKGITEISFQSYPRPGAFTQKIIDAVRDKKLLNISLENLFESNGEIAFGLLGVNLDCLSSDIANASGPSFNLGPEEMISAISELLYNAFTHGNKADPDLPIFLHLDMKAKKAFVYDLNKPLDKDGKGRLKSAKVYHMFGAKKGIRILKTLWQYERSTLSDGLTRASLGTEVSIKRSQSFDFKKTAVSNTLGRSL
ncbi:MAG: nucleotidyltransferase domain-containing protein, partial [Candidatus Omnitrophica bacterium]|nr:nucleotidyltransferase domain-containing protein [Candidatus Omnitrophota bacterium]